MSDPTPAPVMETRPEASKPRWDVQNIVYAALAVFSALGVGVSTFNSGQSDRSANTAVRAAVVTEEQADKFRTLLETTTNRSRINEDQLDSLERRVTALEGKRRAKSAR